MAHLRPSVVFPWRCSRCVRLTDSTATSTSTPIRTFTSSTPLHRTPRAQSRRVSRSLNNEALNLPASARILPESPRYIDVPKLAQPQLEVHPWVKGTLPVPRDIFPMRRPASFEKATPERLAALQSEQRRKFDPRGVSSSTTAHAAWKARLASQRRTNLRLGLSALAARAKRRQAAADHRQVLAERERAALLQSGARPDEALTRPSLPAAISLDGRGVRDADDSPAVRARSSLTTDRAALPDPYAAERHARKSANVAERAASRVAATQDALHELYTSARHFIVSEAALDAALDREFGTAAEPRVWGHQASPFDMGRPPSLADIAEGQLSGRVKKDSRADVKESMITGRMKRLAEGFTGGKM